ncbi:hypothetical protein NPIL_205261 [Nephila pilipes]|uniref:Uncharacterized protein n=1 Tax=Nephila pilipes TaxID=299642 RepID=A0A8X6JGX8_NEPPI|nr:hypothetical protein NPIL_205261 [Nephila pilipes]
MRNNCRNQEAGNLRHFKKHRIRNQQSKALVYEGKECHDFVSQLRQNPSPWNNNEVKFPEAELKTHLTAGNYMVARKQQQCPQRKGAKCFSPTPEIIPIRAFFKGRIFFLLLWFRKEMIDIER